MALRKTRSRSSPPDSTPSSGRRRRAAEPELAGDFDLGLLPMERLGAHERGDRRVHFGFLLPWVAPSDGHRLFLKIIHERDQFLQQVPPRRFPLKHSTDPTYGDYWSAEITVTPAGRGSHFGQPGRYLYRYELESPGRPPLDWIVDPYAREHGIGHQSAFTLGYRDHAWGGIESTWKTPPLRDLVVYELMVHEFAGSLDGARERLPYLQDLGINCVELMPVANVARSIDWGFEPIGPFGLDERFGKRRDLQRFVEEAHSHGIAVILDMIYGHTGSHFAYEYVYSSLGYRENPFMGAFAADMFGPSVDYERAFARDFFLTANLFWLDRYHIDGIRYDCVPNYYKGPAERGYAELVYDTHRYVQSTAGRGHWQRFFPGVVSAATSPASALNPSGESAGPPAELRLIQCAEQLEKPVEIVEKTYSTCTWQDGTLAAFTAVAEGDRHADRAALTRLGFALGLDGYPEQSAHGEVTLTKSAFQYFENHDHSRLLCSYGLRELLSGTDAEADRGRWYKLQPHAIALLLARGVPLLWQGQELGESYFVPSSGYARIGRLRPVRWEFFYDTAGRGLITLYRTLLRLRAAHSIFRRGTYYFHNHWDRWQSRGLLLFSRYDASGYALVALNFTDDAQDTEFWFPGPATYRDALSGALLTASSDGQALALRVPSNYGQIWIAQPGRT